MRTEEKRAVKTINKLESHTQQKVNVEQFKNEVKLLASVDHPNIIKIYEYFEDNRHFHLVTELCTGGELFDFIINNRCTSEVLAA